ncbi:peptide ABC transporter substrate-binding protein [Lacticaseibacillus pabuli]|uniref:Peptide ABC transporter substrate-binding protein n=1 Tax=Lacticaseibacillus pabuli TaxID=3025672 RepID=A0ABY7WRT7_9LACO|nr:peptide ABC transporter substrate-binding protein [Lacticaseibacillus sp. KACC 23028]WDF82436.1 peptide ABC transporter substrate-binding protein [Lacticaseibacillus sp. KACC 23028]
MKKKILMGAAAAALTVLLAACGGKSSSSNTSSVRIMAGDIINTMDAAQATDVISGQALANTMSGLYRFHGNKLEPDMAAKMATVSKDQKTYTFHLRKGTTWNDGKAVTAQDFAYSWRRAVDPATKSQYAYIFSGIKNADAIANGKMDKSKLGVEAPNKSTFIVHLDKAMPYFEKMITLQTFDPVEKSKVEKYGNKYGTSSKTIAFNGPYTMKGWSGSDQKWNETKNPKYWDKKNIKINKLSYQVVKDPSTALNLYQDNKLDDVVLSGNDAQQMKNNPAFNNRAMNATYYLELNANRIPAFKNEKVRQAISMAINRPDFIKQVLGNGSQPISTVVATKMMYNDKGEDFTTKPTKAVKQYTDYDLKGARKLFSQGMKEVGSKSVNYTLTSDDTALAKNTLEYLQNALEKLSTSDAKMKVTTRSVPFKTRLQLSQDHKSDMVVTAWSPDFPDAISFLSMFTTGASYNDGQFSNAQYDKLINASSGVDATNADKRWNDMQQASELLTKTAGVIPLYQLGESHLTRTSIKGMAICPNGMINFVGAHVDKK